MTLIICDGTAPTKTGLRRIRHARQCVRRRLPFIRLALGEMGIDYLCHGCYHWWHVPPAWGKGTENDPRRFHPRLGIEWWGWRVAAGTEPRQTGQGEIWVQECGRGVAHLQESWGVRCGRASMRYPYAVAQPKRVCKRCGRGGS